MPRIRDEMSVRKEARMKRNKWFAGMGCAAIVLCLFSLVYGQSAAKKTVAEPQSETERQIQKYGLDYVAILKKAEKDPASVRCLLLLGVVFDGAASDEYAHDITCLLKKWGDAKATELVQSVPAPIYPQVLDSLSYEVWHDNTTTSAKKEWLKFKKDMPELAALIERHCNPDDSSSQKAHMPSTQKARVPSK